MEDKEAYSRKMKKAVNENIQKVLPLLNYRLAEMEGKSLIPYSSEENRDNMVSIIVLCTIQIEIMELY